MDLRLYLRVMWRFRYLVLVGFLLAFALAFLTVFRVDRDGITYRQHKTYQATEKILLTNIQAGPNSPDYGTLTVLDAQIGQSSDVVRRLAFGRGPLGGTYLVTAISGGTAVGILPLLQVDGFSNSPQRASFIAAGISRALKSYLPANVPANKGVVFKTIKRPNNPFVSQGRKLTVPIVIFLSVLVVTLGLAFILENLRPRAPARVRGVERVPEPGDDDREERPAPTRRSTEGSPNGDAGQETAPEVRPPVRRSSE